MAIATENPTDVLTVVDKGFTSEQDIVYWKDTFEHGTVDRVLRAMQAQGVNFDRNLAHVAAGGTRSIRFKNIEVLGVPSVIVYQRNFDGKLDVSGFLEPEAVDLGMSSGWQTKSTQGGSDSYQFSQKKIVKRKWDGTICDADRDANSILELTLCGSLKVNPNPEVSPVLEGLGFAYKASINDRVRDSSAYTEHIEQASTALRINSGRPIKAGDGSTFEVAENFVYSSEKVEKRAWQSVRFGAYDKFIPGELPKHMGISDGKMAKHILPVAKITSLKNAGGKEVSLHHLHAMCLLPDYEIGREIPNWIATLEAIRPYFSQPEPDIQNFLGFKLIKFKEGVNPLERF